ncbi:AlpA family phage regulatory protein [Sphingosinicellaceae bacterium]|nr:AlpA family phage regulatory protein [Sphingosinicellaceae bacterium]
MKPVEPKKPTAPKPIFLERPTFNGEVWRMKQLVAVLNLSASRIYEMVQKGEFPRPFKLSTRASAWPAAQVRAWLDARIAERD